MICLLASAAFSHADWPHFLGPTFNGRSPEKELLHQWPKEGPTELWEFAKGSGHAGPVISGDRVVLFHTRGSEEMIECLDAATGKQVWHVGYDADYTPEFGSGPGPKTTPVISNGKVFTLGIKGTLHCLDLASGKVNWKRDLAKDYQLLPTFFGQGGTPLPLGELLIVPLGTTDEKSLVALDVNTGKEVWAAKHPWGSSYASPVPATLHGRDCFLAFQGGRDEKPTGGLLIIDAKTGDILSAVSHRARMFASVSISSPVVAGNRIFVSEAYTEGGMCVEVAPDFTTKVVWRDPDFATYMVTAVPNDGYLYAFSGQHQQNAELVCYDIATGKPSWRDDLGGKFQRGSLLRVDGSFLCLGENGDLAWLSLLPKGPSVTAHAKLFNAPETWAPPAVSEGRLFVCQNQPGSGGTKPRLICYDLRGK